MKTYRHLWEHLCSLENLQLAYEKARRHKTNSPAVRAFAEHHAYHLAVLRHELRTKTYRPQPLQKFILRDPKTRVICKSAFRDRIIHHALINILQPIYEPRFIHDSYASRQGKGTLAAIKRFEHFARKITKNGTPVAHARSANDVIGYALKCDVKHYFDTVDHETLIQIIARHIRDPDVLWLVRTILDNHDAGTAGRGMPLGNWTSQFFANIYLNELDQFVKHDLRAPYYLRYVDDFVILERSSARLQAHQEAIRDFLRTLHLDLHPNKCSIIPLRRGVSFLGSRVFYHYKLVRRRNLRTIRRRITALLDEYEHGTTDHEKIFTTLHGWQAYAMHNNTYRQRQALNEHVIDELQQRTRARRAKARSDHTLDGEHPPEPPPVTTTTQAPTPACLNQTSYNTSRASAP